MRPFYVTSALLLVATILALGCSDSSTPPAPKPAPQKDMEAALDSIEQWLKAAQPAKAEVVARALVQERPGFAPAHTALGRVLMVKIGAALAAENPQQAEIIALEALEQFQAAIELGESSPEIIRSAGIAAEQAGQLDVAISLYKTAAASDEATALYLCLALLRSDRPVEAQAIIEPLCAQRPSDPFLHATLAECLAAAGKNQAAIVSIQQAVRLAPDEPAFRIRRAAILRKSGQALLAAETLLALPEQLRTTLPATEELTAALSEINRLDQAAEVWATYARANPNSITGIVSTVDAYIDSGNFTEAQLWIDVLVTNEPTHPSLAELREKLNANAARRQGE